jgi:hypothetical protein
VTSTKPRLCSPLALAFCPCNTPSQAGFSDTEAGALLKLVTTEPPVEEEEKKEEAAFGVPEPEPATAVPQEEAAAPEGRGRAASLDDVPTSAARRAEAPPPPAGPGSPGSPGKKNKSGPKKDSRLSTARDPTAGYHRTQIEEIAASNVNSRADASRFLAENSKLFAERERITIPEAPIITGGSAGVPKPRIKTSREHVDEFSGPGREGMHTALAGENDAWNARPADKSTKPSPFSFFWTTKRVEKRASDREEKGLAPHPTHRERKGWFGKNKVTGAGYTDREHLDIFYSPGRKVTSQTLGEAKAAYEARDGKAGTVPEDYSFAARDRAKVEEHIALHGPGDKYTTREKNDMYWNPGRGQTHQVLAQANDDFNARPKDEEGKVLATSGKEAPSFWRRTTPKKEGAGFRSSSMEEINRFSRNMRDYVLLTKSREQWEARPRDEEGKTIPTQAKAPAFAWTAALFKKKPSTAVKGNTPTDRELAQKRDLNSRKENAAASAQAKENWLSRVGPEGYVEPTRADQAPAMASDEAMESRAAYHASLVPTDYGDKGTNVNEAKAHSARARQELAEEAYHAKKAYAKRMGLPEPPPPLPEGEVGGWDTKKVRQTGHIEFAPIPEGERLDYAALKESGKSGAADRSALADKDQDAWNARMGRPSPRKVNVDGDGAEFTWKMNSKKDDYHDARLESVELSLGMSKDDKARLEKKHREELSEINAREAEKFKRRMEAQRNGEGSGGAGAPRAYTTAKSAPATPKRSAAKKPTASSARKAAIPKGNSAAAAAAPPKPMVRKPEPA